MKNVSIKIRLIGAFVISIVFTIINVVFGIIFSFVIADLYFYRAPRLAAFRRYDNIGNRGRCLRCGETYGYACGCACIFYGGQQHPLYQKRHAGNLTAGLSEDCAGEGDRTFQGDQ